MRRLVLMCLYCVLRIYVYFLRDLNMLVHRGLLYETRTVRWSQYWTHSQYWNHDQYQFIYFTVTLKIFIHWKGIFVLWYILSNVTILSLKFCMRKIYWLFIYIYDKIDIYANFYFFFWSKKQEKMIMNDFNLT